MTIKIKTMNKFNLDQLRSDAARYLAPQLISSKSPHQTISESVSAVIPSIWFDHHVNHMICALIGADYYAVMNRNPLTTIRFDFRGSHQVLNMGAYKWATSEDII